MKLFYFIGKCDSLHVRAVRIFFQQFFVLFPKATSINFSPRQMQSYDRNPKAGNVNKLRTAYHFCGLTLSLPLQF